MNTQPCLFGILILIGCTLCNPFAVAALHSSSAKAPATGGAFAIRKSTIDSGGSVSAAGGLTLSGTIGQTDATRLTGDGFILNGGFWATASVVPVDELFANGFESTPLQGSK